jgi:hypothetical protein
MARFTVSTLLGAYCCFRLYSTNAVVAAIAMVTSGTPQKNTGDDAKL